MGNAGPTKGGGGIPRKDAAIGCLLSMRFVAGDVLPASHRQDPCLGCLGTAFLTMFLDAKGGFVFVGVEWNDRALSATTTSFPKSPQDKSIFMC